MNVRRLPRAGALVIWPIGIAIVFGAVPVALSFLSHHHGWHHGRIGAINAVGLLPLTAGVAVVVAVCVGHYRAAPAEGWALGRGAGPTYRPEYLLRGGVYAWSRNPLYVGERALLAGWVIVLGSIPTAIYALVFAAVQAVAVRGEERRLTEDFGDSYRAYQREVPRWLAVTSPTRRHRR